jgi:DNA mismatch endonuclease (patch repair protein)
MTDCFSPSKRSWVMAQIKGADTKPERLVRRLLHASGFRYRLRRSDLPGKPDIVLSKYATVIFVNGCFWHGHTCREGRRPRTNIAYWNAKLDRNIARDARLTREYRRLGWRRVVVWECQLRDPEKVQQRFLSLLKGRIAHAC